MENKVIMRGKQINATQLRVHAQIYVHLTHCLGANTLQFYYKQHSRLRLVGKLPATLENVKGEFESLGELLSVRETGIGNRHSPMDCVSKM